MLKPGIAGVGCALLDLLHTNADVASRAFQRYLSRSAGDGGLVPGELVFASALERFAGVPVDQIVREICGPEPPAANLGGPAVVALVLAAQALAPAQVPVRFFGVRGDDEWGNILADIVKQTPLDMSGYDRRRGTTPSTRVLSDPHAADGSGERTFINDLGVAATYRAEDVSDEFFTYQIALFGGTALVPELHAHLGAPLSRARASGALTVVATVFDFWNQERAPDRLWPLGDGKRDYPLIDLLMTDAEEARRLSGESEPRCAIERFLDWGVGAAIVTAGADPVWYGVSSSTATPFLPCPIGSLPVSAEVRRRAADVPAASRDTTGCGDNFSGGVLTSVARQRQRTKEPQVDLRSAVIEGIAAGAAAWFQIGGTRIESIPGETLRRLDEFRSAYLRQLQTQDAQP